MEILLIVNLICGTIAALVASHKGRNAVGWFLLGFFFGWIPIVIVAVIPNLKDEQARYERAQSERRRLREQLKMERMRAAKFEQLASERLDIHDRALGMDTSRGTPPELGAGAVAGAIEGPAAEDPAKWYFAPDGREAVGPLPLSEFAAAYREGRFGGNDLVWKSGWRDWRALADVDGLEDRLLELP